MSEYLFWISIILLIYIYAGYPVVVYCLSFLLRKNVQKESIYPKTTIIIAAYNEEESIERCIQNKLSLYYPKDRLQVIVISDDSTDKTDEIVRKYEEKGVLLIRQSPRAGKTAAINLGIQHATGEVIVFSDANSIYAPDAVRHLVANFADPSVGYVTGKMVYITPDGSISGEGCSAYMKYENFLRSCETKIGSIVGVDGGIDAIRRDLYSILNPDQLPDFVQPLKVVEKGYRVVYEPEALLMEETLKESGDEYKMRVRVGLRAMWALYDMRQLLWLRSNPLFSWQLWSHKLLRYHALFFMIIAISANILIYKNSIFYRLFLYTQIICYAMATASPLLKKIHLEARLANLAYYFLLINLASAHAILNFLRGKKQIIWSPRKG